MSYAKRVEIQREHNRRVEKRRKAALAKRRAGRGKARKPDPKPLEKGEISIWRKMFNAFTGHRSRKSIEAEKRMLETKARVEAEEAAKVKV